MATSEPSAAAAETFNNRLDEAIKAMENDHTFNAQQKTALESLKKLHVEHVNIEKQYRDEWTALKLKYFKFLNPLYEKRTEELKKNVGPKNGSGDKNVLLFPEFWLTALKNHSVILRTVEPHDEPVLRYLENIRYEWKDENNQMSFRVHMDFEENPFFEQTVLTKEFELDADPETSAAVLTKSVGTTIDWRPGKDISRKTINRKQRNKRTGEVRFTRQVTDRESFFHFFDSHEIPDDDKLRTMRDREVQDLENTLEVEYELGCILRDKIIPHALGWFLGIEVDEDYEDDGQSDEEESMDDDDNSTVEDVDEPKPVAKATD